MEDNGKDIAEDLGVEVTKRGPEPTRQRSSVPHIPQHSSVNIEGMCGSALFHLLD